jgi:hypothetical protein
MIIAYEAIAGLAILTMVASLVLVMRLRRVARGGKIGRAVSVLAWFIVLFLVSYLSTPWFPYLPHAVVTFVASLVFLFGAVFVVIVLWLIERLIGQVFDELKM